MIRQVATFGLVGIAASVVHYLAALGLIGGLGLGVFAANIAGFALAFCVSYLGHYHLTFATGGAHRQALPRFLATALAGFAINNGALALLLRLAVPQALSLALAIAIAAACTFFLARLWAFSGR